MSHQYGNKSKSQLTSPMPAQLPAVAVSTGHIVHTYIWQNNTHYCLLSLMWMTFNRNDITAQVPRES
jgi:hypothetical protein